MKSKERKTMINAKNVFLNLFTCDSRPFNPFHKPPLQGEIDEQHREDDQEGCGKADAFVQFDGIALVHLLVLRNEIRKRDLQIRKSRTQKKRRDVGFIPIPNQTEKEACDVGGSGQGHGYPEENVVGPGAVDFRRFRKRSRNHPEELVEDQDEDRGIQALAEKRGQDDCPWLFQQVQFKEHHIAGNEIGLGRNDEGEQDDHKKRLLEFEVESCKTVADDGGDRRLEERRDQSHQKAFPESREIVEHPESPLVVSEIERRRNPVHHRIDDVGRRFEAVRKHVEYGIKVDEADCGKKEINYNFYDYPFPHVVPEKECFDFEIHSFLL